MQQAAFSGFHYFRRNKVNKSEMYQRLHFLRDEAPLLLNGGDEDNVRKVLQCRMWVDRRLDRSFDGYAWWLLVSGDVKCAKQREGLKVLSLAESIELGAVCQMSWHSLVWQNFQGGQYVEPLGD